MLSRRLAGARRLPVYLWAIWLILLPWDGVLRGQETDASGQFNDKTTTPDQDRNVPRDGAHGESPDSQYEFEGLPTAIFAGGCFWTMEVEFEKLPGVVDVVSGYAGGKSKSPTYQTYASKGHREVVWVRYDPTRISYQGLVEFFLKRIDPHDLTGSFIDRGRQYGPAIFVSNEEERTAVQNVFEAIDRARVFRRVLRVPVVERSEFWPAEDYHQDFARRNPHEYASYRSRCGRDDFIAKIWGAEAFRLSLPGSLPASTESAVAGSSGEQKSESGTDNLQRLAPWFEFEKPCRAELKRKLTRLQFQVTQENHTELPFNNKYWKNHERGIYVDIVSGEPLFLSTAKFNSGTGWPSFVRPVDEKLIVYRMDYSEYPPRVEVRSKCGDSHLGHVFGDGPLHAGGRRFCINSAALRFIPIAKMSEEGYGAFLNDLGESP